MTEQADYNKLSQLLCIATDRLQKRAQLQEKSAFVPTDVAAGGGAPPMDPAMAGGGGMPPMDPAMMGGGGMPPMDPSMMGGGGGMPMDPAMMGGGGGDPMEAFRAIIKEEMAAAGVGGGAGGAGAGAPGAIKPKIDVNVELMQIKKMLARLLDTMGVTIPASEMVATPDDMMQMAQGGGMGGGAPMPPGQEKPASDDYTGSAYQFENTIRESESTRSRAAALAEILGH